MLLASLGLSLIAFAGFVVYVATGAAVWLWLLFSSAVAGLGTLGADMWRRRH